MCLKPLIFMVEFKFGRICGDEVFLDPFFVGFEMFEVFVELISVSVETSSFNSSSSSDTAVFDDLKGIKQMIFLRI